MRGHPLLPFHTEIDRNLCPPFPPTAPHTERYVPLDLDDDTRSFLEECEESTLSLPSVFAKPFVEFFVAPFLSRTSVNGLLLRGQMHVLSTPQVGSVLGIDPAAPKKVTITKTVHFSVGVVSADSS